MSLEIIVYMGVAALAMAIGVSAWVYAVSQKRKAVLAQESLQQRIDQLENELTALMDGSFGMGAHIEEISRDLKGAIDRQQQLEQQDLGDLPYNEAVRLVAGGAGADELMQNCGLSKSEADLVLLLHKASPPIVSPERAEFADSENPDSLDDEAKSSGADIAHPFAESLMHREKHAPMS